MVHGFVLLLELLTTLHFVRIFARWEWNDNRSAITWHERCTETICAIPFMADMGVFIHLGSPLMEKEGVQRC